MPMKRRPPGDTPFFFAYTFVLALCTWIGYHLALISFWLLGEERTYYVYETLIPKMWKRLLKLLRMGVAIPFVMIAAAFAVLHEISVMISKKADKLGFLAFFAKLFSLFFWLLSAPFAMVVGIVMLMDRSNKT